MDEVKTSISTTATADITDEPFVEESAAAAELDEDPTSCLPDELMIIILQYVGFRDACRCVCRRWHRLCNDRQLNGESDWQRWVEIADGTQKAAKITSTAHIEVLAVSPDGTKIYGGTSGVYPEGSSVHVWRASDGELLQTLKQHTCTVRSLAVGSDGKVYSGSEDRSICVWCGGTGELLWQLKSHNSYILGIAVGDEHVFTAAGGQDRTIGVWSTSDGAHIKNLHGHTRAVVSLLLDQARDKLYSGSSDHTIRVWSASTFAYLHNLRGHSGDVYAMAAGPGGTLFTGGKDRTVFVWSSDGVIQRKFSVEHVVRSLAILPSGLLFYGLDNGSLGALRQGVGARRRIVLSEDHQSHHRHSLERTCVVWSPGGSIRCSSGFEVHLWECFC